MVGFEEGSLIIYDVETDSWWSQLFGHATQGPLKGQKLVKMPSTMTTWKKWKSLHADTTAYVKRSIPYHPDFSEASITELAKKGEGALEAVDLVIGIEGHLQARAYLLRHLAKNRVLNDVLEGHPLLVFLSEDLTTARVLDRAVDGKPLTFSLERGDKLQDAETKSIWDPLTGEAISGSMKGKRLQAVVSTHSYWFAWKKYRPDTELIGASELN